MQAPPSRSAWILIALVGLALMLRLAGAWWWQARLPDDTRFAFGDSLSYWMLAESIASGGPFEYGANGPRIFRTPGYPCLLAPLFWLHAEPPVMWARIAGAIMGTAAVLGTVWLGTRLFNRTVGYVAGGLAAVYPGAVGASVFVLSEAPYCPLLVAQLGCWVTAWKGRGWQTLTAFALLAGLAAGAATLVRPSHLLFTPFALGMAMFARDRRRNLIIGAVMLSTLAVVMTPWWWRNYQITGRFVATTLQFGASLYDGLNPQATGASDMRFVADFLAEQERADQAAQPAPAGTFEERLDERMRAAAVQWIRREPGRAVALAGIKFLRMWSPLPHATELQSWTIRAGVFLSYTPLMLAAAWGAWQFVPRGWPYALCLMPALYLTLLHMVFVSSIRYREPAMFSLIVLAAGACWTRRVAAFVDTSHS